MKSLSLILMLIVLSLRCATPLWKYDKAQMEDLWGEAIRSFDRANKHHPPAANSILFYGSSSIRLWSDINTDMAPYPVVRRAYGGASLHDAAYFATRVLPPIEYSALVLFIGNDIWGGAEDKQPHEMQRLYERIVDVSRRHRPLAPIFIIEVTQVPARCQLMEAWDAANAHIRSYTESEPNLYFIPSRDIYVDHHNQIQTGLFKDDGIHQNELGYALWTARIKQGLRKVMDANYAR